MSSVNEIRFSVEQAVLDIGVKIVFPVIEGIDNTLISPEWMEKRKEIIDRLLKEYRDIDYHADPILEGLNRVMIDCAASNIASDKTIQALGGILERCEKDPADDEMTNVYWINVEEALSEFKAVYEPFKG